MKNIIQLLADILPMIESQCEFEGYGFAAAVEDPRDFTPDYESCSEEEIENWKKACELAEKGEYDQSNHAHKWVEMNGMRAHISYNPFGIGTYTIRDKEMISLSDRIKAAIAELEVV